MPPPHPATLELSLYSLRLYDISLTKLVVLTYLQLDLRANLINNLINNVSRHFCSYHQNDMGYELITTMK